MDLSWVISSATFLSGVGACASALATFLTVREMKKHREASCKPDLVFSACTFTGEGASLFHSAHNDAEFLTHNIGVGAAKNISIKVVSNISSLLESTNNVLNDHAISMHLDKDLIIVWKSEDSEYSHGVSVADTSFVRHILPNDSNGVRLRLPGYISFFVDFMSKMAFVNDIHEIKYILQQLCITYIATYQDMGGKIYTVSIPLVFLDYMFEEGTGKYVVRFK